ncbi:uncharacterized protein [Diadema antillarum]|uniref:uncharacterized protein n=1 Tax=Diadema antillarum TaxID=105358 RepID=UPI003A856BD4
MPKLSHFEVKNFDLPDGFFSTAAELAKSCQIQTFALSINGKYFTPHKKLRIDISPTEGRGLAKWVCTMPKLSGFLLEDCMLPDEFFSTAAEFAEYCQIQSFILSNGINVLMFGNIHFDISPTQGRCLAELVCTMPKLSRLVMKNITLPEEFFSTAAEFTKSCQIEGFRFSYPDYVGYRRYRPANSPTDARGLAKWVCTMPKLSHFKVISTTLTDEFISTVVELAKSCQIERLSLFRDMEWSAFNGFEGQRPILPTEARGLARWVCTIPKFSRLDVEGDTLPDEFFSTAVEFAESCQFFKI